MLPVSSFICFNNFKNSTFAMVKMKNCRTLSTHRQYKISSFNNLNIALEQLKIHLFAKAIQVQTVEFFTADELLQMLRANLHQPKLYILNQRSRVDFHYLWLKKKKKKEGFKAPILYSTRNDASVLCVPVYVHSSVISHRAIFSWNNIVFYSYYFFFSCNPQISMLHSSHKKTCKSYFCCFRWEILFWQGLHRILRLFAF